ERLISEKENRPLIANIPNKELPEFIGKHLFERSYFYSRAQHTVLCDNKSVNTLVDTIYKLLV
ncbi:MAG: shikimate kinase, partial [Maribacter sp.]